MLRKTNKHRKENFTIDKDEFLIKPKNIIDVHSYEYTKIMNIFDIILKFIIENKLTIVGGMSINYSLMLKDKKDKLYDVEEMPDYDIICEDPVKYAYAIARILSNDFDIENIDIIRAIHISTVKVRYNLIVLLDLTFISPKILNKIPLLEIDPIDVGKPEHSKYGKIKFVHPYYQFMDMHYALANPYENSPLETVLYRTKKDIHRYNKIFKHYNVEKFLSNFSNILQKQSQTKFKIKFTEEVMSCINKYTNNKFLWSGFIAYYILIGKISEDGPKLNDEIELPLFELKILSSLNSDEILNNNKEGGNDDISSSIITNISSKLRMPKNIIIKFDNIKISIEPTDKITLCCKKYKNIVHIQELLKYFITEYLIRSDAKKYIFLEYYEKTRLFLEKNKSEEIIEINEIFKDNNKLKNVDFTESNIFPVNVRNFDEQDELKFDYTRFPWID